MRNLNKILESELLASGLSQKETEQITRRAIKRLKTSVDENSTLSYWLKKNKDKKALSMDIFLEHIVAVLRNHEKSVSYGHLQKIAYFVLKEAHNKRLLRRADLIQIYDKPFYVWGYGPYNPNSREPYKRFAHSLIIDSKAKSVEELDILNVLILKYANQKFSYLVEESYENKFWQENQKYIEKLTSDIAYSLNDL